MKTLSSFILFILFVTRITGQVNQDSIDIKNIEQKTRGINSNIYEKIDLHNEAFLDSGFIRQIGGGFGHLIGYFKNDTIFKIHEYIGIRLFNSFATTDYYYAGNKLIFAYEAEFHVQDTLVDSIGFINYNIQKYDFEGSYYFTIDKMISVTNGKQMILPNEMYFDSQSKAGQLQDFAEKYSALLTKAKKK